MVQLTGLITQGCRSNFDYWVETYSIECVAARLLSSLRPDRLKCCAFVFVRFFCCCLFVCFCLFLFCLPDPQDLA